MTKCSECKGARITETFGVSGPQYGPCIHCGGSGDEPTRKAPDIMLVDIPMPHFPQTAPLTTRLNIAVARALANIPEPPNGSIPVDVNGKIFGAEDYNRLATDAANDLLPVGGAYGWLIVAANSLEQIGSMDPIYGSRHHSLNALGRALAAIHEELEKMK